MPSNTEVAEVFRRIADLLDVLGERFKPEAYRRAARSLEGLPENIARYAERNELRAIPGVGEAIAEKIGEYLRSGEVPYLTRLEKEIPPGVVEIMRLPGLGPKTARRFWTELGIEGPAELAAAIDAGRLAGVKGFGDRKIGQIREALRAAPTTPSGVRMPIDSALPIARGLVAALRRGSPADRVEVAGSFRRGRETVGDLDLLVTSGEPERVFDCFSALPEIGAVRMRGPTKETVVLRSGLQVDLRVVEPAAFGAALQYFTGSKDHNVRLRSLARDAGLKVNEYGVFRGEERVAGATEEEVYRALGLHWIPPELREDRGEIDLARAGPLARLVEAGDLQGDRHVHLPADATPEVGERVGRAARARRLAYIGLVIASVAPDGTVERLADATVRAVRAAAGATVHVVPLLERGASFGGEPPADLVYEGQVVAPGAGERAPLASARDRPVWAVAHAGGPLEQIRPAVVAAAHFGSALEVGPGPARADSTGGRAALDGRVPLAVATGVGEPDPETVEAVALAFARRAGAGPDRVANAGPAPTAGRSRASR